MQVPVGSAEERFAQDDKFILCSNYSYCLLNLFMLKKAY